VSSAKNEGENMVKDISLCLLFMVLFSVSAIALESATLPDIPEVGEGSCVEESGTCGADSTQTDIRYDTQEDTSYQETEYMDVISKDKDSILKAISQCEVNVRDCRDSCASMPNSPRFEKNDCYSDCGSKVLGDQQDYEHCFGGFVDSLSFLYSAVSKFQNECPSSDVLGPCLDTCMGMEYDDFVKCMEDCDALAGAEGAKYDICATQAYSKAEVYLSDIISNLPAEPSASPDAQDSIEQPVKEAEENVLSKKVFSIGSSKGSLTVQGKDGSYRPISTGTMIAAGDKIKTGPDGMISVTTPEGHIIEVGPNSEIIIEENEKDSLTLNVGKLWARFKHMGVLSKFRVRTPTAVCSVRGTEFIVEYDSSKGETMVDLLEGQLEITNVNDEVYNLEAGNSMVISQSGAASTSLMQQASWDDKLAQITLEKIGAGEQNDAETKKIFTIISIIGLGFLISGIVISRLKRYKNNNSIALGISGLILSVFSIFFCILPFLGLPFAIVAVIFSNTQKKNNPTMLAKIGSIISIIGITLNAITLIGFLAYLFSI
jgi:hypothetical protein